VRSVFRCVASRNRKNSPAPGFRDSGYRTAENGAGKLYAVGASGYSWSTAIAGITAHFLDFGFGGISPQYGDYRAFGLQLRCLQE
jgi:hypothetical protein